MLRITVLSLVIFFAVEIRIFEYKGKEVRTTFSTPEQFYGTYTGKKDGFLRLKKDGTGEYRYDIFGFAPADCIARTISIEWGLIVNESDEPVSFERAYGKSYPILMKSTGETKFQGCRKEIILDFIMEYKDGTLGVSSSDDWKKK